MFSLLPSTGSATRQARQTQPRQREQVSEDKHHILVPHSGHKGTGKMRQQKGQVGRICLSLTVVNAWNNGQGKEYLRTSLRKNLATKEGN